MARFANSVLFSPASGGVTDFIVSAAVQGYMTPALAGAVTGVYKYRAESADLSQWEIGEGTYTSGTTTLTRTTVLYNSAGTGTATGQSGAGSKINFSTPPKVGIVQAVQDMLEIENAGSFTSSQILQARANIGIPIGQIPGETSNTAATAGRIGEVISATATIGSLVTGTGVAVVSITLTAGDWDISGTTLFTTSGGTSVNDWSSAISTTSGSVVAAITGTLAQHERYAPPQSDHSASQSISPTQVILSGSTTYYLNVRGDFTGTAPSATGIIRARRVR